MTPLLTRNEVAKILKMTPGGVSKMVREKRITFIRIGKRPLFKQSDIENWINKRQIKTA